MTSDCLAFTAIPHTSRLFSDYLYSYDRVQRFYALNPRDHEQLLSYARGLRSDAARRRAVADILERQNREFGGSEKTLENVGRLMSGAVAAVAGQQVGLFGGPLYSMLKAVSAIRMARDLTAQGMQCVPVFWLATEDHDLAEVNHTTLLNLDGLPERVEISSKGAKDAPMSEVRLGEEVLTAVQRATELLGDSEVATIVRETYRPGESMGTAFGKLFAKIFADYGLILLDASDRELHAIAQPMYTAVIEKAGPLAAALLERGKELREAGYHEQVKVTPETTLLFEKRNGARTVIHRANAKNGKESADFTIGKQKAAREELLERIRTAPHTFSANVLLRPVVQDYLLPVAGYFGGPAEVAYFAQLDVVHRELLGTAAPILPRFSATLVDARAQRLMQKYGIGLSDLFGGPAAVRELLGSRSMPAEVHEQFEAAEKTVGEALKGLMASLQKLDPTLVEASERSTRKMQYQLSRLRKRVTLAEVRRNDEMSRHAEWLSANLYPDKGLQEREIAGISYLARFGKDLLDRLVERAGECPDHQVIPL